MISRSLLGKTIKIAIYKHFPTAHAILLTLQGVKGDKGRAGVNAIKGNKVRK